MKRPMPSDGPIDLVSSDESDSETGVDNERAINQSAKDIAIDHPSKQMTSEDALFKRAEMYQEYMKQISIPTQRGSLVPCTTWMGLGKSIKELYGQPLHYLTNIMLKQWDQMRIGSEDEHEPLDTIIHPSKAEATIWLIEEIHRRTSSYYHVAKLWQSDPMYHASIDSIFPQL